MTSIAAEMRTRARLVRIQMALTTFGDETVRRRTLLAERRRTLNVNQFGLVELRRGIFPLDASNLRCTRIFRSKFGANQPEIG